MTADYSMPTLKRILSLDGGGVRGIVSLIFLERMEEKARMRTRELFDFVIGTSTGGLAALALTQGQQIRSATQILKVYLSQASNIFGKENWIWNQLFFGPKYNSDSFGKLAKQIFGQALLSECCIPTAVTSYDTSTRKPHLLASWSSSSDSEQKLRSWEAAMATSAAPTYFPPCELGDRCLVDGGVYANNPTVVGISEAKRLWNQDNVDFLVVSIGTGVSKVGYLASEVEQWGMLKWVHPLVDCMFDASSESVDRIAQSLVGSEQYFRLQCPLQLNNMPLDEVAERNLMQLVAAARRAVEEKDEEIDAALDKLLSNSEVPPL